MCTISEVQYYLNSIFLSLHIITSEYSISIAAAVIIRNSYHTKEFDYSTFEVVFLERGLIDHPTHPHQTTTKGNLQDSFSTEPRAYPLNHFSTFEVVFLERGLRYQNFVLPPRPELTRICVPFMRTNIYRSDETVTPLGYRKISKG